MKNFFFSILILAFLFPFFAQAATVCPEGQVPSPDGTSCVPAPSNTNYQLLSPLPCNTGENCVNNELKFYNTGDDNQFSKYLNMMLEIFIGICAVLAVVMIVVGGLEYMTSELPGNKESGKNRITQAVAGLVLALGAWLILNTINPELLTVDLPEGVTVNVDLESQIAGRLGQSSERCVPITDASSPCAPANLSAFANPEQASSICNGESGGQPGLASGVDVCKDNNSFSFGLFQINIIAHANNIPGGVCSGIFQTSGGGTQGACLERGRGGVCVKYDCRVTNPSKYQSCVSYITNPANNIAYAAGLRSRAGDWTPWGFYASCRGKF